MTRKQLLVLSLAAAALGTAALVTEVVKLHAYRQKQARGRLVDRADCDRIRPGMGLGEVEAVLGGPPGDFRTNSGIVFTGKQVVRNNYVEIVVPDVPDGDTVMTWVGNGRWVKVGFDGRCQVQEHTSGDVLGVPPAVNFRFWPRHRPGGP